MYVHILKKTHIMQEQRKISLEDISMELLLKKQLFNLSDKPSFDLVIRNELRLSEMFV